MKNDDEGLREILEMALQTVERQRETIKARLDAITPAGRKVAAMQSEREDAPARAKKRHVISAAGRKRIAAAQRKRWANVKAAGANSLAARG